MDKITFENLPQAVTELTETVNEIKRVLLEKTNQGPEPEELLTIKQASILLNLSIPTLYGYSRKHEIPVCKRGSRLFFSKNDLFDWVKSARKKTVEETSKEAEDYIKRR